MAAIFFIGQFLVFPLILNAGNALVDMPKNSSSYPACLDCLENLALFDLKLVEILQFQKMAGNVKGAIDYTDDSRASLGAAAALSEKNPPLNGSLITRQAETMSQNPISAYRLIYRFVRKFPELIQSSPEIERTLRQKLPKHLGPILDSLPNKTDLLEAALGILRIQMIYNISSADLRKGDIVSMATGVTLESHHCYHLGVVSWRKLRNYPLAFQWFNSTLDLLRNDTSSPNSSFPVNNDPKIQLLQKLETEIESAITKHNEEFISGIPLKNTDYTSKFYGGQLFPSPLMFSPPIISKSNFPAAFEKHYSELDRKNEKSRTKMLSDLRRFREEILWNPEFPRQSELHENLLKFAYNELCAGRDFLLEVEKSRLFCWLEREVSPYYKIGPMKMELISRDPGAVQVYDLLPPGTIQKIEEETKRMGKDFHPGISATLNDGEREQKIWDVYIAMDTTFYEEENISWNSVFIHGKELFGISRENHSITKYTFMGRFLPHVDYICPERFCKSSERLANYIIYLSDVTLGGYTVFPLAGVSVRPVKGSALFFFNLHGDLDPNKKSIHAGCPPVLGKKVKMAQVAGVLPRFKEWKCPAGKSGQSFQFKVNGVLNYEI